MPDILSFLTSGGITLLSFVAVLGLLVFVHELGHFVVAKWAGIRVEEFGFGYPPRMVTLFKKGETEYTLNWLPLGGFVRMVGENGENYDDPRSFASKSKLWRAAVLVAGSTMNLILPIFLFSLVAMIGIPDGDPTGRVEVVGIEPNSPAAEAGLRSGDEILFVGSQRVMNVGQLQSLVQRFEDRDVIIDVDRDGQPMEFTLTPRKLDESPQIKIGVAIVDQREIVRYNPFQAIAFGVQRTASLFVMMVQGFVTIIGGLFAGTGESAALTGPLGIMQATGEIAKTETITYGA
ncbi:MAG: site-2 protease family protein [Ardenticatenales bacterium]|nr:site-2 protease family protein [Ardenticatenales bacterium]